MEPDRQPDRQPDRHLGRAVEEAFHERFGRPARGLYRAPGRVNLIGEHTDYNDGFVLPMAIDRAVWLAATPRDDRQVHLAALSLDPDTQATFSLNGLAPEPNAPWSNYVRGVLAVLEAHGHRLAGLDVVYDGDVPIGAGLSSSAAVEVAIATAANDLFDLGLDDLTLARICQEAEHTFAGTQCGLMDQLISVAGREDHALLIDCRSFEWQPVPLPGNTSVVVCDTGKRRGLAESAYNERRAECEEAARRLGVPTLRDLDVETFEARAGELPLLLRKRARHVVHENDRTVQGAAALRDGDVLTFGQLMKRSHASLRDLYEVSSDELDIMAAVAQAQPGCRGARMTGAGFGGCVVALVDDEAVPSFVERVTTIYERQTRITPALYVTHASEGASSE
jgi:galactokinase